VDDRENVFRSLGQVRNFSTFHKILTDCGVHESSCYFHTGCSFPAVKWPEGEDKRWYPFTVGINNAWNIDYTALNALILTAWSLCLDPF
jgi:hypothetical protein